MTIKIKDGREMYQSIKNFKAPRFGKMNSSFIGCDRKYLGREIVFDGNQMNLFWIGRVVVTWRHPEMPSKLLIKVPLNQADFPFTSNYPLIRLLIIKVFKKFGGGSKLKLK